MHKIIENAKKLAESAEIFDINHESRTISFENNKFKAVSETTSAGSAIRVVKKGKLGAATSTKPADVNLLDKAIA